LQGKQYLRKLIERLITSGEEQHQRLFVARSQLVKFMSERVQPKENTGPPPIVSCGNEGDSRLTSWQG